MIKCHEPCAIMFSFYIKVQFIDSWPSDPPICSLKPSSNMAPGHAVEFLHVPII